MKKKIVAVLLAAALGMSSSMSVLAIPDSARAQLDAAMTLTKQNFTENEGTIKVGKVNVDENPDLARKYRVMSIPTVLVFKNGELTATSVGVDSKENILKLLEK